MLFYFKKGKNTKPTALKIYATYWQIAVSDNIIRKCFEKFKSGNFSLEYARPSSVKEELPEQSVAEDPLYTVQKLSHGLNIPKK